jgi:hypothetical protein
VRRLKWVSGILWIWSWFTLWLEIFRWHHMTTSLHFNPPPPPPGSNITPQPGLALITVLACSVVAPVVFLSIVGVGRVRKK